MKTTHKSHALTYIEQFVSETGCTLDPFSIKRLEEKFKSYGLDCLHDSSIQQECWDSIDYTNQEK